MHDIGLRWEPVAHIRHVPNIDRAIPNGFDRQIIEFRDRTRTAVDIDVILKVSDLGCPGRQNQILRADGIHHVHRRQALGLQRVRVQVHHYLALFPSIGVRNRATGYGHQASANKIHAQIEQLLF